MQISLQKYEFPSINNNNNDNNKYRKNLNKSFIFCRTESTLCDDSVVWWLLCEQLCAV
jgi:hypothetical protein